MGEIKERDRAVVALFLENIDEDERNPFSSVTVVALFLPKIRFLRSKYRCKYVKFWMGSGQPNLVKPTLALDIEKDLGVLYASEMILTIQENN
uniref:Uncharacterized protein n=1 Tax=Nelumbo nucifera TaxID=4432 RepID=A0A822ZIV4_NELNU|nr:TPA_asm: hypothetical protein HUJ06_002720 [Nelumbo nucifera]